MPHSGLSTGQNHAKKSRKRKKMKKKGDPKLSKWPRILGLSSITSQHNSLNFWEWRDKISRRTNQSKFGMHKIGFPLPVDSADRVSAQGGEDVMTLRES